MPKTFMDLFTLEDVAAMRDRLDRAIANPTGEREGLCDILVASVPIPALGARKAVLQSWLYDQFMGWPHYSGRSLWPVPEPQGFLSTHAYITESSLLAPACAKAFWELPRWSGEYGGRRIHLAYFLRTQLQDLIHNAALDAMKKETP